MTDGRQTLELEFLLMFLSTLQASLYNRDITPGFVSWLTANKVSLNGS